MGQTGKGSGTAVSAATGKALSDLKTVCEYYGWNQTHAAGLAELTNFINHTIQLLCMLAPWPEYHHLDGSATFSAADDQETLDETNIIRLGAVVRDDRSTPLGYWTPEEWLQKNKFNAATGPPTNYTTRKYTSSGLTKVDMYVYPKPAAEITLYYTYQTGPTTLVNNSDTTDWPTDRIWLLSEALKIRLAAADRDTAGVALYSAEFTDKVNMAYNQARPNYMPIVAEETGWRKPGDWPLRCIEKTVTS